jgi:hypothetical protein
VAKKIKRITSSSPPIRTTQGTWARSNAEKAHDLAKHLAQVFQAHPTENKPEEEETLTQLLETAINTLTAKKSPGYELITSKILKELSIIGIKYLTQLFHAILLKGLFPAQWKVVQIILTPKSGKPPNELTS